MPEDQRKKLIDPRGFVPWWACAFNGKSSLRNPNTNAFNPWKMALLAYIATIANKEDKIWETGGVKHVIERGQVVTSYRKLDQGDDNWFGLRWGPRRVRYYCQGLRSDGSIVLGTVPGTQALLITITNAGRYWRESRQPRHGLRHGLKTEDGRGIVERTAPTIDTLRSPRFRKDEDEKSNLHANGRVEDKEKTGEAQPDASISEPPLFYHREKSGERVSNVDLPTSPVSDTLAGGVLPESSQSPQNTLARECSHTPPASRFDPNRFDESPARRMDRYMSGGQKPLDPQRQTRKPDSQDSDSPPPRCPKLICGLELFAYNSGKGWLCRKKSEGGCEEHYSNEKFRDPGNGGYLINLKEEARELREAKETARRQEEEKHREKHPEEYGPDKECQKLIESVGLAMEERTEKLQPEEKTD